MYVDYYTINTIFISKEKKIKFFLTDWNFKENFVATNLEFLKYLEFWYFNPKFNSTLNFIKMNSISCYG